MTRRPPAWRRLGPLLVAISVLTGCDSLPQEVRLSAEKIERRLEAAGPAIDSAREKLRQRLASPSQRDLEPYAQREDWEQGFSAARAQWEHLRAVHREQLQPLLDENASADAERVSAGLRQIEKGLEALRAELQEPFERADALLEARDHGAERVAEAESALARLGGELADLDAQVTRAFADYPAKEEDLRGRHAAVRQAGESAASAVAQARSRLAEYGREQADLAQLADAIAAASGSLEGAGAARAELGGRVAELYRSYAKTLVDMQEIFTVVVGRSSWNDYYDFPTEHSYAYPARRVDAQTLEALDRLGDRPLYANRSLRVSDDVWRALGLDLRERLPRGDNAAELWVQSIGETYQHRYEYVEGETHRQGEWEDVDADFYEKHADHLGMDILVKPYGFYEDEVLREASPPGMAFVGNPRYGRWESDGRGGRRWSWLEGYLFYRLMFGGRHYYHYGDWNAWNGGYRGRRAYYGPDGDSRRYGTGGSLTRGSSRYAGSTFARRGGFRRGPVSFRGAGPAGRGGGPGGRGK